MNVKFFWPVLGTVAALAAGCHSVPPGAERGPDGTIAHDVLVEASPPGAKIEVNNQVVGDAPLHLKVFGNKNGTFHDFGSYIYAIRALPLTTNQFVQARAFRTGRNWTPKDKIPDKIFFDMSVNPALSPPPAYVYPPYPYYPYPYYAYPPPYFYGPPPGPGVRLYFGPGPGPYHHW